MNEHHRNCVIDNGFVFFTPLWFWFGAFIKNGKLTHKKHIFNYDEVYIFVYTVQCTLIYIRFYMQWCFVTGQFFESGCVRCWANSNNNKKRIVCEFPTKIIGRERSDDNRESDLRTVQCTKRIMYGFWLNSEIQYSSIKHNRFVVFILWHAI